MKILIISDIHGNFKKLIKIKKIEDFDVLIFAGDGTDDIENFSLAYSEIPCYLVKGNVDIMDFENPIDLKIELESYRFFISHGHYYSVKNGYEKIVKKALEESVDICIFGHTHMKFHAKYSGIDFINPGSLYEGDYGIMEIENKKLKFEHRQI